MCVIIKQGNDQANDQVIINNYLITPIFFFVLKGIREYFNILSHVKLHKK